MFYLSGTIISGCKITMFCFPQNLVMDLRRLTAVKNEKQRWEFWEKKTHWRRCKSKTSTAKAEILAIVYHIGAWLVKKDLAKLSLATRLVSWKVSVKPCESCYLILFLKTVIHFFIFFAAFKETWVNDMTCRKRKFFLRMQDLVFHSAMGRAGNLKERYWSQKLCPNKYTRH